MKNFKLTPLIFFIACTLLASCTKEGHHKQDEVKAVTLNVTVNSGTVYALNLKQYGDDDGIASITQQAADYTLSEITKQGNAVTYSFSKNTNGKPVSSNTETVKLKVAEPGGCRRMEETNITINFTIQ